MTQKLSEHQTRRRFTFFISHANKKENDLVKNVIIRQEIKIIIIRTTDR